MNKSNCPTIVIALLLGAGITFIVMNSLQPKVETPEALPEASQIQNFEANPYLDIPVIDAYYEGEKLWFIHTDVADEGMAKMLTNMVNFDTIFSARLGDVPLDKVGKIYVFTNGPEQSGVKPWGGGPFNYQIDIFDSIPGDEGYTPIRNPQMVSWNDGSKPRILKSMDELLEAEKNGELTIKQTNVVVNVPIVKWPSDYLGGSSLIEQ